MSQDSQEQSGDLDPEAMAVAWDAIRDAEFEGIPPRLLSKALMKASVELSNSGYDTLGGRFDPGTWEAIATGEREEVFGVCPLCDWQHTHLKIDPDGRDEMVYCPRDGVSEVIL